MRVRRGTGQKGLDPWGMMQSWSKSLNPVDPRISHTWQDAHDASWWKDPEWNNVEHDT